MIRLERPGRSVSAIRTTRLHFGEIARKCSTGNLFGIQNPPTHRYAGAERMPGLCNHRGSLKQNMRYEMEAYWRDPRCRIPGREHVPRHPGPNNVDLRVGFPPREAEPCQLVCACNDRTAIIAVYAPRPDSGTLIDVAARKLRTSRPRGIGMYLRLSLRVWTPRACK